MCLQILTVSYLQGQMPKQEEEKYFGETNIIIVYLPLLLSLFDICKHPSCGAACDPANKTWSYSGAMITVKVTCNNSHQFTWSSSPSIGRGKSKMAAINVLIGTFAFICGVNFKKVVLLFILKMYMIVIFSSVSRIFGSSEGCLCLKKFHLSPENQGPLQCSVGFLAIHAGITKCLKIIRLSQSFW